jgi:hypothetical protein
LLHGHLLGQGQKRKHHRFQALLKNERSLLGSQRRTEQALQGRRIEGLHTLGLHASNSTSFAKIGMIN